MGFCRFCEFLVILLYRFDHVAIPAVTEIPVFVVDEFEIRQVEVLFNECCQLF